MVFPFDLFNWLWDAGSGVKSGIGNWLGSIGGSIASGLESGFIAILKDIWDVIRPFLYLLLGAGIIIFAFAYLFKDDIMAIAKFVGSAAALAAV